jgi:hypothetical protein
MTAALRLYRPSRPAYPNSLTPRLAGIRLADDMHRPTATVFFRVAVSPLNLVREFQFAHHCLEVRLLAQ